MRFAMRSPSARRTASCCTGARSRTHVPVRPRGARAARTGGAANGVARPKARRRHSSLRGRLLKDAYHRAPASAPARAMPASAPASNTEGAYAVAHDPLSRHQRGGALAVARRSRCGWTACASDRPSLTIGRSAARLLGRRDARPKRSCCSAISTAAAQPMRRGPRARRRQCRHRRDDAQAARAARAGHAAGGRAAAAAARCPMSSRSPVT